MRIVAVIPARFGSSRLPGKPLLMASGKSLIQRVWEGVKDVPGLDQVLIATDDERILGAARSFGAQAVMTLASHASGTDRTLEAVRNLAPPPDAVLNVQGDSPGVGAAEVEHLARLLEERPEADVSTLAYRAGPEAGRDPSRVKVVLDSAGFALYFSRSAIPWTREGSDSGFLVHQGLYGYRMGALQRFVSLPRSSLEILEDLEQLRALEAGMKIAVGVSSTPLVSIDTPEDFRKYSESLDHG